MTQELQRLVPPITMMKQEALIPHAYRLVIITTHCSNCGRNHETSQIFQINTLRSRVMNKPGVTNSISIDHFQWNVPLQIMKSRQPKSIPVCHECFETISLSHLPTVPTPEPEQMGGARNPDGTSASGASPRTATRKLTVDDL